MIEQLFIKYILFITITSLVSTIYLRYSYILLSFYIRISNSYKINILNYFLLETYSSSI